MDETSDMEREITFLRNVIAEKDLVLSLSAEISQIRAKQDLMHLIKEKFQRLFYFYHCTITINNEDKSTFKAFLLDPNSKMKGHGNYDRIITSDYPVNDGIVNVIQVSETPMIFNLDDLVASGNAPEYITIMHHSGIRQLMGITLTHEREIIGVLAFYSDVKNNFNPYMFPVIRGIVSQISLAVINILASEALEKKNREREVLLSISSAIASVKDRGSLLNVINKNLKSLFFFSHSITLQLSEDGEDMKAFLLDPNSKSKSDPDYNKIVSGRIPVRDGMIDEILNCNEPVIFDIEEKASKENAPEYIKMNYKAGLKELMGVSLHSADNKSLGTISFYSDKMGGFDKDVLSLVHGVAYHISTAMANILHHEEIKHRDKENQILINISDALSTIKDKTTLIRKIKQELKSTLTFSDICISLYNLNIGRYTIFVRDNVKTSLHEDFERIVVMDFPIADGMHNVTMASDYPVVFPFERLKVMAIGMPHINFIVDAGIREVACIKLKSNDEVVGALVLLSEEDNSFPVADLNLIERVSHHMASGVCNIIANEKLEKREQEKALLLSEKSLLLSFSSDITSVRMKEEVSQIIYKRLKEMIYYDEFVIALINETGTSHYAYLHGFADKSRIHPDYYKMSTDYFPIDDGFYDRVLELKDPRVFDLANLLETGSVPDYLKFDYDNGIREIVGVPLRNGSKTLGAFFILLENPRKWSQSSLRLIQGISYQLSISISNLLANAKIEQQLVEINKYKQQLEEEKFYLQEEAGLGYSYNDIIGFTPEMQQVFHHLSQVSLTNTTVLLLGETGTGKELVARAIHNSSSRKDRLMVKVNCAALPAALIESELFGHERGSFTGATERRLGKFELANHGTLFLDEIGDMSLELQVKLLRAIQEREIERVGGKATIKVDVRIIAATNRNLKQEVDEGKFRSDLYYRLNVFPITLPPLRDHKEDIPALASHFLTKYAKNNGKKGIQISNNAMKELMAYNWPGNVQELEHLIERSILMSTNNIIREMHLPKLTKEESKSFFKKTYRKTFEENERDYIIEILNSCNGKIFGSGGAAEILNMKVGTLNSRIRKLGIKKEQTVFKKDKEGAE